MIPKGIGEAKSAFMDRAFLRHRDVDMALEPALSRKAARMPGYVQNEEVMIHYTVTEACPFNCRGCINALTAGMGRVDRSKYVPNEREEGCSDRDIKGIAQLIKQSGKDRAVIVYYGGEPMLRLDKMNRFKESLGNAFDGSSSIRYMVITSGHYLEQAIRSYPELISDMWLTAVSVDGTKKQHEAMRRGTSLETIRRQVAALNRIRKGEVLIWSTLRPGMSLSDCFTSYMVFRERGHAQHFFWHWDEADAEIPDLAGHLESYTRDLDAIMGVYVDHLAKGDLLSMVHINELLLYFLTQKRRGSTACAVEKMANFDIIGDGRVHACADLPETMDIGDMTESGEVRIRGDAEERLANIVAYKGDLGCDECGVEPYCGGRCPVQVHIGGIERARQYCFMMREHVRTVKHYLADITELLVKQDMGLEDLYRSARYARFTDVTP